MKTCWGKLPDRAGYEWYRDYEWYGEYNPVVDAFEVGVRTAGVEPRLYAVELLRYGENLEAQHVADAVDQCIKAIEKERTTTVEKWGRICACGHRHTSHLPVSSTCLGCDCKQYCEAS